jgi:putative ABC transport system permease protein
VVPLQADIVGASRGALALLMGAVGMVLLIACVNVAQLLGVRGLARQRELAVRAALGCGRLRLVRQLLLESLLLASAGALGGLLLAHLGSGLWLRLAATSLPRAVDGRVDSVLVGFAVAIAVVTAVLFGLSPALRASQVDVGRALHETGRGHSGGAGLSASRRLLVATQLGLTFVLTSGALLLTKSFLRLADVDLSVETEGIVAFDVSLPDGRYPEPERRAAFHARLAERLEALPGARAAGSVSWLPARGHYHEWGIFLPRLGDGTPEGSPNGAADQRVVEGRFFEALRIPLLRGRLFDARDAAGAPPVVLVNEALVRRYFPKGRDPIGEMLSVSGAERQIVGVVADTAIDAKGTVAPLVYHPHRQMADDRNWPLVQVVAADESVSSRAMADVVRELDPNLVLHEPRALAPLLAAGISRERLLACLLVAFATIALLLAGLGLFGVLSHSVGQRRREFGVRMALGAGPGAVRALVLRQAAVVATIGALVGLATSLWAGRWVGAFLFETDVQDPATLAAAAAALVALTLLAAFLPARRATRVGPAEVLRAE